MYKKSFSILAVAVATTATTQGFQPLPLLGRQDGAISSSSSARLETALNYRIKRGEPPKSSALSYQVITQSQEEKDRANVAAVLSPPLSLLDAAEEERQHNQQQRQLLEELRAKELKDLKLMCSRRCITYRDFGTDKEQYIEALMKDVQYSTTGTIHPGKVAITTTATELEQEIASTTTATPILVDVCTTFCGPCQLHYKELEQVSKTLEGQVRIVKLNIDTLEENANWASRHNVQGLPTTILIKDRTIQSERLEGAYSHEKILEFVQPHLVV